MDGHVCDRFRLPDIELPGDDGNWTPDECRQIDKALDQFQVDADWAVDEFRRIMPERFSVTQETPPTALPKSARTHQAYDEWDLYLDAMRLVHYAALLKGRAR
jgi:hypothetical protein